MPAPELGNPGVLTPLSETSNFDLEADERYESDVLPSRTSIPELAISHFGKSQDKVHSIAWL